VSGAPPDLVTLDQFITLAQWRRDVRRFQPRPVASELLERLLGVAHLAPSVGNSQPWRIVRVESWSSRAEVRANFEAANRVAACSYDGEQRVLYESLKLSGFDNAPVHLAVFCDPSPREGAGLGRRTQPETLDYSCAGFINTLWLAARTQGIGLGWVSILETGGLLRLLDVPPDWRFIGYLLMGYPEEEHTDPELVRHGWQTRSQLAPRIIER
jgi:5,6-dimethylbenzimidazole synthase